MITGNDNIFNWMRINGNPYWTLRDQKGDKSRPIAESEKTPSLGMEESISRLKQVFAMKGNRGQYYIITRPSQDFNSTRDIYQDYVELGEAAGQQNSVSGMGVTGGHYLTKESLQEELKKAREDWEKEQHIKKLEEEINELKSNKKSSTMEAFIGKIEPYMPQILGALFNQQKGQRVGIAGFHPVKSKQETRSVQMATHENKICQENGHDDLQQNNARIQNALEKLDGALSKDGIDIIEVLEKLAAMAAENPAKIRMAITMIL
jgi:hypothetical protein